MQGRIAGFSVVPTKSGKITSSVVLGGSLTQLSYQDIEHTASVATTFESVSPEIYFDFVEPALVEPAEESAEDKADLLGSSGPVDLT
jgi:hypothetical protein